MTLNKMLLAVGAAAFMGVAVPAPAQATWCWFGKCGGTSTGGNTSTGGTSTGGSSGGTPTPVPEPEQMALFAMGAAVLVGRVMVSRRKRK
ncbi:PEP-CTERM sorting domain-containing protein [Sphingobium sp. SA2]|uniref:PEP-CTERM sorting domain-containing protein n=1 Tax=Sphingobium sp. SA2 TaxID=1524832 RepID=UPI0028C1194B|nr:PEP-CTERM sorting domain-containing protein [Sphingobium sp. SA2]MDT7534378.1 PEP-CTERM sorting domain-containing protein [Sphingobium sp. SA2]|tara:strand:- start:4 stop:273 length:270 start_codon:yes stop_codon:yes gene_type:complete